MQNEDRQPEEQFRHYKKSRAKNTAINSLLLSIVTVCIFPVLSIIVAPRVWRTIYFIREIQFFSIIIFVFLLALCSFPVWALIEANSAKLECEEAGVSKTVPTIAYILGIFSLVAPYIIILFSTIYTSNKYYLLFLFRNISVLIACILTTVILINRQKLQKLSSTKEKSILNVQTGGFPDNEPSNQDATQFLDMFRLLESRKAKADSLKSLLFSIIVLIISAGVMPLVVFASGMALAFTPHHIDLSIFILLFIILFFMLPLSGALINAIFAIQTCKRAGVSRGMSIVATILSAIGTLAILIVVILFLGLLR